MNDIDTTNYFLVSARGDAVIVMSPPRQRLTADEAFTFAAWLVAVAQCAGGTGDRFDAIRSAVENT